MTGGSILRDSGARLAVMAIILFALVAGSVALTARDPGLTWDESIYYGFALQYHRWFQSPAFDWPTIEQVWWRGQVHPPLGSVWIAANLGLFGNSLDVIAAARMGAAAVFGAAAAALFLWVAARRGARAGWFAAAAFVLMPRIFAHGHFANLEMLTVLWWLLTTVAFERGITSWRWSIACGIFFGLGLLTKINAAFLPVVLVPWGLLFHGRKAIRNILCMALIGPALFFGGWPVMWHHPVEALKLYLHDKTKRMLIPTYYLGTVYNTRFAPWHYPFVMLLATTPLPVLAAAAAGVVRHVSAFRERWRDHGQEALVLASLAFPVCLLALPNVPKYDGVRLMLPAFPFLAALAAEEAEDVWEKLNVRRALRLTLAALVAVWLLLPVALFHPYQLSYYGELAGGPWGAKRLGFETTYWDDTLDGKALAYLNEHVPPGGRVALVAVGDFVWQFYRAMDEVRADIRLGDFESGEWDFLLVVPREGWLTPAEREYIRSHEPVWINGLPPCGRPVVCEVFVK